MSLQKLAGVGHGGAGLQDRLPLAVKELQSLKQVVVDGAAANTNIAVAALLAGGTVLSVVGYNAGVPYNTTAAAGNTDGFGNGTGLIRLTEVTTGHKLVVTLVNKGKV